jgi:hypothetical protein
MILTSGKRPAAFLLRPSLTLLPHRTFYFQLEVQQRNLDFPLNLGFNDHFKYHSQALSLGSTLWLALRRRAITRTFLTHYGDLLQAIAQDNYEALEQLCEPTLLEELAAKVYEYEKYRGVQFRVV